MILRLWKGTTKPGDADRYLRHLADETFPQLNRLPGFKRAGALRRGVADGVEFLVVSEWDSLTAIRGFAGEDVEAAVVPEAVRAMMIRYDRRAVHYELAAAATVERGSPA